MIEGLEIQEQLQGKWILFLWALAVGLLASGVAWRQGLFKPFRASSSPWIRGIDVFKGFSLFLVIELFLVPALFGIIFFFKGWSLEDITRLNDVTKGWINLCVIVGGFVGVMLAYFGLSRTQRQQLWQQTSTSWIQNIGIGIAVWFVSYPLVLAFSQLVSVATWHLFHHSTVEQVVVQNLRKIMDESPLLFGLMALSVITIVPLTEEILFRGLLQSWLKRKFQNATAAIVFCSLIFAIFHFSSVQGVTNIELLFSLFLLSCVLGFIYERQRSLWAPVGLHSFFNLMSLLLLFKQ